MKIYSVLLIFISFYSSATLTITAESNTIPINSILAQGPLDNTNGDPLWANCAKINACADNIMNGDNLLTIQMSSEGREFTIYKIPINCNGAFTNRDAAMIFSRDILLVQKRLYFYRQSGSWEPWVSAAASVECYDKQNKNFILYNSHPPSNIIGGPESLSVCNLNSQNLLLNFSSESLMVAGLSKNTNLTITCTAGNARDYKLRLTGTNVTNGKLDFKNGVYAQISLDGIHINANGDGINLNGLVSREIQVKATLSGSASTSGITTSNGILILEAL